MVGVGKERGIDFHLSSSHSRHWRTRPYPCCGQYTRLAGFALLPYPLEELTMSEYEYDFSKGVEQYKRIIDGGEADWVPVTTQMAEFCYIVSE